MPCAPVGSLALQHRQSDQLHAVARNLLREQQRQPTYSVWRLARVPRTEIMRRRGAVRVLADDDKAFLGARDHQRFEADDGIERLAGLTQMRHSSARSARMEIS